jgi:hypothetical protein
VIEGRKIVEKNKEGMTCQRILSIRDELEKGESKQSIQGAY